MNGPGKLAGVIPYTDTRFNLLFIHPRSPYVFQRGKELSYVLTLIKKMLANAFYLICFIHLLFLIRTYLQRVNNCILAERFV